MKKDIGKEIAEYENLEKQLEMLLVQKHQVQVQLNEVRHALEHLKEAKGEVYKSVGTIILYTTKEEAEKELKDKEELLQVRLETLTKQEEKLREKVTEAQKRLQEKMGQYGQQ